MPQFIFEANQKQVLTFDWIKFVAIALPVLFITVGFILYDANIGSVFNFLMIKIQQ